MEIHESIKIHWQQFKKCTHAKVVQWKKTDPIPRFEIIGRFNLTDVPHDISRWTTYVTMVKCTVLETENSRCRIEN